MRFLRPTLSLVALGAALFTARPALSAPSLVDRLVAGSATPQGAALVAGDHGATYELRGGALLDLAPGTTFSFEPSIRLKLRKPGDPETSARQVRVEHGRAEVTIPAKLREQTAVLLKAASKLSAVAKEGVSAFVMDDDRTTAASRAGEMLVGVNNEWKALKEGFARTIAPEDPMATPRPIIGGTVPQADHALVVVQGGSTGSFSESWAPVKDAATYDVTLAPLSPSSSKTKGATHRFVSATTTAWQDLPPGAYAVTVSAIDKFGLPGAASAPSTARIVGLDVPPGVSVASDGTVALAHDERVSLEAGAGLEVSYGASPVFISAPDTLGLAHNMPTLVRLRAAGSKEETIVKLEPKGLRANVSIGPKVARWPLDRVMVEIELYDANGHAVPENADVAPTVTVNLDPVAVKWVRSGRTLRAELPAGMAPGPWVVRAEVRDPRGDLIGRDFLEVAPIQARPAASPNATAALSR